MHPAARQNHPPPQRVRWGMRRPPCGGQGGRVAAPTTVVPAVEDASARLRSMTPIDVSAWTPPESDHPLAALEGRELAGGELRVLLGPTSRFGARYFALLLRRGAAEATVLSGLHRSGPLPSYNWIEVAETHGLDDEALDRLFALLLGVLPAGGHIMVEYDSGQRAETAEALAHNVPHVASPLGAALFRAGFGAHFKDWQIAEGGSEGPRKLQAYSPLSPDDARRWRERAALALEEFLERPAGGSEVVARAKVRAERLLPLLRAPVY